MSSGGITFCPECGEEQFEFTVTDSGRSFDGEVTSHWFEGDGFCHNCGYEGEISDISS